MEFTLKLNQNTCIKCSRCVQVCPATIFSQNEPKGSVEINHPAFCIFCGHCVAACPTASVEHSIFPPSKAHPVNKAELPSPQSVMLLCKSRRSNRGFSAKPVPMEMLDMILEAAHRAPTASNRQEVHFTLITDKEKLRQVIDYTVQSFASVVKTLKNPLIKPVLKPFMPGNYKMLRGLERLQTEYDKGNDLILRGATALMFIHTPADNRFGRDDSNLAYQNGSLMAESLGVSQFYTGFVCTAIRRDKKNKLAKMLGVEGTIHAGMALGMPAFTFPNYIDKKEIVVRKLTASQEV